MANQLKVAKVASILALREQGWSCRRIARELGVHRATVARYVRQPREGPNPANPLTGSSLSLSGRSGPASACTPYRQVIIEKLDAGLAAPRIYQDLKTEHDFPGSYSSVQRYVRRLRQTSPRPYRRMECEPGAEGQIDLGRGAPVVRADGRRRRTYVFRIVLSHCRKGYSEAVYRQTTEDFIRCLENAFWSFGGAQKTLVPDNLRAAVSEADWYDPEINPKLQAFCAHYGTVILPTKPYTPVTRARWSGASATSRTTD